MIQETETSVILILAARRRIQWGEIIKLGFYVILIIGMISIRILPLPDLLKVLIGIIMSIWFIYNLLYQFIGRDVMEIDQEYIKVQYGVWILKRSHRYMASKIKELRCTETTYFKRKEPFGHIKNQIPIYVWETIVDPQTSTIVCDYDGQMVSLLGWIEKPLAKNFVSLVKRRFSNYR
jgi:hypothetical protein